MLRLWWNSADSLHHHVGWVDAGATDGPRLVLSKVLWVDGISQVNSALPIYPTIPPTIPLISVLVMVVG